MQPDQSALHPETVPLKDVTSSLSPLLKLLNINFPDRLDKTPENALTLTQRISGVK